MLPRLSAVYALISIAALLGAAGIGVYEARHQVAARALPPKSAVVIVAPASPSPDAQPSPTASATPAPTPLPASVVIEVPYTSQSPQSRQFDAAHEEYCEAAATYMVGAYYQGDRRTLIPGPEADSTMARIVAWERAAFPHVLDLPLADVAQVGAHFYNLDSQIMPVDLGAIERSLASGHPVLVPVMTHGAPGGRPIAPYYGAQDVYHVLVLTGYDQARGLVFTNDAGFNVPRWDEGRDYAYPWSVLSAAIQAQTASPHTTVRQGEVMLVFRPRA